MGAYEHWSDSQKDNPDELGSVYEGDPPTPDGTTPADAWYVDEDGVTLRHRGYRHLNPGTPTPF